MYIPKYFKLYEVLPKDFYNKYYPKYGLNLWRIFDDRLLRTGDALRGTYGKMVANDWYWGGKNQYRGYRPPNCKIGAELSQHRFARALDLVPAETLIEVIRKDILDGKWPLIKGLELDVDWLHFDIRNSDKLITFTR